ncbi:MAG TPA: hypothetical protein VMV73_03420, partial [Candidatus Dormibacteraeota bacterium]|nr:hypothetical protein [Candidatus Dormibacteraeota bacterium]
MPQGPDFDLSADMRLLELQRQASGRPTRARSWEQRSPDLPDESEIVAERPVVEPRGAVLQIQVTASPERGLIPGALLTVTLAVINESSMSAEGVVVGLPLPAAARARTGSLSLDERALDERAIESVTGEGFSLGTLAAGERRTLKWQLEVGAGTAPLLLAPFAHSKNAAMLGAK